MTETTPSALCQWAFKHCTPNNILAEPSRDLPAYPSPTALSSEPMVSQHHQWARSP
jgi:hypothetical protein